MPPFILWQLSTRVRGRSNASQRWRFGVSLGLLIGHGLIYEDESFLLVRVLEVVLSVLVRAVLPRYAAKSAFFSVLTCKVSYDPS